MDRNRKLVSLDLIAAKKRKHRGVLLRPDFAEPMVMPYSLEQVQVLRAAENLGRTCHYESDHTNHVTTLALQLFDGLQRLHQLGPQHRFYLQCAGIMHDIGWIEGWKGHHKASLRIILRTTLLPLEHRERLIVGSVARYHTRALPGLHHDHFAALAPADRDAVLVLAACLRLADALDRTHRGQVQSVRCRISRRKIRILYRAAKRQLKNEKAALKNSDLLKLVFNRDIGIRMEKSA
jgi:exopolyphosphatase/pppGpp-phosphohydrolase